MRSPADVRKGRARERFGDLGRWPDVRIAADGGAVRRLPLCGRSAPLFARAGGAAASRGERPCRRALPGIGVAIAAGCGPGASGTGTVIPSGDANTRLAWAPVARYAPVGILWCSGGAKQRGIAASRLCRAGDDSNGHDSCSSIATSLLNRHAEGHRCGSRSYRPGMKIGLFAAFSLRRQQVPRIASIVVIRRHRRAVPDGNLRTTTTPWTTTQTM